MTSLNKNLDKFAEALEKFHISSQPTIHKIKSASASKRKSASASPRKAKSANATRKLAKKAAPRNTSYLLKNTSKPKTRRVKSQRQNAIERRRKTARLRMEEARAQARKQKAKKAAEGLVLEGRTRSEKKSLAQNIKME